MKKIWSAIGILSLTIMIAQTMLAQEKEVTLVGTVVAVDWDDDDNPVQIALSTEDEDIIIAPNDIGTELFDLIDAVIRATGTIVVNDDDEKVMTISAYEELDPAEDEPDDEYEPGS